MMEIAPLVCTKHPSDQPQPQSQGVPGEVTARNKLARELCVATDPTTTLPPPHAVTGLPPHLPDSGQWVWGSSPPSPFPSLWRGVLGSAWGWRVPALWWAELPHARPGQWVPFLMLQLQPAKQPLGGAKVRPPSPKNSPRDWLSGIYGAPVPRPSTPWPLGSRSTPNPALGQWRVTSGGDPPGDALELRKELEQGAQQAGKRSGAGGSECAGMGQCLAAGPTAPCSSSQRRRWAGTPGRQAAGPPGQSIAPPPGRPGAFSPSSGAALIAGRRVRPAEGGQRLTPNPATGPWAPRWNATSRRPVGLGGARAPSCSWAWGRWRGSPAGKNHPRAWPGCAPAGRPPPPAPCVPRPESSRPFRGIQPHCGELETAGSAGSRAGGVRRTAAFLGIRGSLCPGVRAAPAERPAWAQGNGG